MKPKIGIFISFALLLTACAPAPGAPSETPIPTQVETPMPTGTATAAPTETPLPEVKKYTQEDLDQMTPEQKIAAAPKIDGLTKSNVSESKPNLIVYRDGNGTAQKVVDLTKAKELTLPEAGIVEFDRKDGGKLEMLSFDNAEDLVKHIINSGTIWFKSSERTTYMSTFYRYPPTPEDQAFYDLYNGSGLSTADPGGLTLPQNTDSPKIFGIFLSTFNINGSRITFKDINGNLHAVYSDIDKQNLIYALRALPESTFEILD